MSHQRGREGEFSPISDAVKYESEQLAHHLLGGRDGN
jgi:hypothetical protein